MAGRVPVGTETTIILVTHDRYFLDAVCNEIIEIDDGKVYVYQGNYDYFLEQKSLRIDVQQSELQKTGISTGKNWSGCASNPKHGPPRAKAGRMPSPILKRGQAGKKARNSVCRLK